MAQKQVDYVVLDAISAVQNMPGMYIGDDDNPDHLATEIIDNMLDEVANNYAKNGEVFISEEDGSFWVSDNGRGLMIGLVKDPDTNEMKDSIITLCTKLHSGSKFRIDKKIDYKVQIGMHGVGLVVVNALSDWLVIRIRNKTKKEITEYVFVEGVHNSTNILEQTDETYSTLIGFKPSEKFFKECTFNIKNIVNRLLLASCIYDKASFSVNGNQIPKIALYNYAHNVLELSKDIKLFQIKKNFSDNESINIFLNYVPKRDSVIIGDVNLRNCDGTYITNIQTMIKSIISENIDRKFRNIDDKEFLTGLRCYVSLTLEKPKFDAQIKSRMKTSIKDYLSLIEKEFTKILTQDSIMKLLTSMLEQKFTKKLLASSSNGNNKRISNTNKLRDCSDTPGDVLYIVEGDSADGTLKVIRNKKTEASFPLKGKMLKVDDASFDKIKKNKEVNDLIEAIGSPRRYKKIKILTDADSDESFVQHIVMYVMNLVNSVNI